MIKLAMLFLTAILITGCAEFPIRPPPLIPLPTPDAVAYYHHHHYYHHRHLYLR